MIINDDGEFILVWLRQTIRGHSHPTIDAAVSLGNELNKPVIVIHCIEIDYPYASGRLHYFLMGASKETYNSLKKSEIRFYSYLENETGQFKKFVKRHCSNIIAIFTDEHFTTYRKNQVLDFSKLCIYSCLFC